MKKNIRTMAKILLLGLLFLNLGCAGRPNGQSWGAGPLAIARFDENWEPEPVKQDEHSETAEPDPLMTRLLELHNERRAKQELPPLSLSPILSKAARVQALDMVQMGKITHEGSDGSNASDRVRRLEYPFQNVGENVATGQETPEEVVDAWMESPGHRENILGEFTEMGAARVEDDEGRPYWCVTFATPIPRLDPAKAATDLLARINRRRSEQNLSEIQAADILKTVALDHARAMAKAGGLLREGPDGKTPFERLHGMDFPFRRVALSTASGQPRPGAVLNMLLNDPDQRRNVLGKFNRIGIGYASAENGTPYWVILFAEVPEEND
ncbi:hypothetical protein BH23PLA1_BH23PLA1_18540 [soil metagenome]